MNNDELVSIVIPVYNSQLRLAKCLNSLVFQSYKNFEVIVVNDGSTDKSLEIIQSYVNKDNRFKVISIDNHGVSYARNLGIKVCQGEYIGFVDSDDELDVNYIQFLFNAIKLYSSDMAICDLVYSNRENSINFQNNMELSRNTFFDRYVRKYKTSHVIGAPFSKLIRRDIIETNSLCYEVGEHYAEDFCFNMKLYQKVSNISIISDKLYFYYEESIESLSKKNLKNIEYMLQRQQKVILPLINKIEKENRIEDFFDEFVVYFATRDVIILMQNTDKPLKQYLYFKKVISMLDNVSKIKIRNMKLNNKLDNIFLKLYCKFSNTKIRFLLFIMIYAINITINNTYKIRSLFKRR